MTAERQDDAGREARDQNDSQDRRGPAKTANALGPREAVRSSLELAREKGPAQVRADECRNEVEAEREVAQDPDPEGPFGEKPIAGVRVNGEVRHARVNPELQASALRERG